MGEWSRMSLEGAGAQSRHRITPAGIARWEHSPLTVPSHLRVGPVPFTEDGHHGREGSAVLGGERYGGQEVPPANHGKSSPHGSLLLCSPFEIPFPSGRRLRPESVREGTQKPLHHSTVLRPHRQRRPLYRCPVKSRGRAGSRTAYVLPHTAQPGSSSRLFCGLTMGRGGLSRSGSRKKP